jgi:hypothetical protein
MLELCTAHCSGNACLAACVRLVKVEHTSAVDALNGVKVARPCERVYFFAALCGLAQCFVNKFNQLGF